MKWAKDILVVLILLMGLGCLYRLNIVIGDADKAINSLQNLTERLRDDEEGAKDEVERDLPVWRASAKQYNTDLRRFVQVLGPTLTAVQKSSKSLQEASESQARLLTANSEKFGVLLDSTDQTVKHLDKALDTVPPTIEQAERDLADLDAQINSPQVNNSLANLEQVSQNGAAISGDVRQYVHRVTKPASFTKELLEKALDWASKAKILF